MLENSTYYILDAQGNQLAMYEHTVDTSGVNYYLTERNIYGSSRLGTTRDTINMFNPDTLPSYGIVGNRNYELSNHLGNVSAVVNDVIYPLEDGSGNITSYEVGLVQSTDYSPFGVQLDGRTFDDGYRYGFNGHERDDEVKGSGNHLSWGDNGYDPRIARRWNIDPKWYRAPEQSPYAANNNNPITITDPDGEFGVFGAFIGAVVGGAVELGSQVISNVVQGRPAFEKIDLADIAIAAGEGALIGSGAGIVTVIATETIGAIARASIDYTREDELRTVGGIVGDPKDMSKFKKDLAGNLLAIPTGRMFGLGKGLINKGVVEKSFKGITKGLLKETGKTITQGLTDGGIKSFIDERELRHNTFELEEVNIVFDKKTGRALESPGELKNKIEEKNPGATSGGLGKGKLKPQEPAPRF